MKYELSDDDVEFIAAAIDTHVATGMARASTDLLRHAGKLPNAENADKWLGEFEDMVLQNRGYITRRESVIDALRKPIK